MKKNYWLLGLLFLMTFCVRIFAFYDAHNLHHQCALMFDDDIDRLQTYAFNGDPKYEKPYIFVSLGCACWPALGFKANGLRDGAFPFDWAITFNNDSLIQCFDEKFKHFLNAEVFAIEGFELNNTHYDFRFIHDWPYTDKLVTEYRKKEFIRIFKEKYARRVSRFENLKDFKGKVFFVRCLTINPDRVEQSWVMQHAKNLHTAIKRLFPELNFTLAIPTNIDESLAFSNGSTVKNDNGIKIYNFGIQATNCLSDEYKLMFADLLAEVTPALPSEVPVLDTDGDVVQTT